MKRLTFIFFVSSFSLNIGVASADPVESKAGKAPTPLSNNTHDQNGKSEKSGTRVIEATPVAQREVASIDSFFTVANRSDDRNQFLDSVKRNYPTFFQMDDHLLNFSSGSPCGQRGAVSSNRPGPISMDPESRITFRYFASRIPGCGNVIEGFQQRRTNDRNRPFAYDFFEIRWLSNGTKLTLRNPISCNRCHGNPPMPIFLTGNAVVDGHEIRGSGDGMTWPTFYGTLNAGVNPNQPEGRNYLSFLRDANSRELPYHLYGYDRIRGASDLRPQRSNSNILQNNLGGSEIPPDTLRVANGIALEQTANRMFAGARAFSLELETGNPRPQNSNPAPIAGIPASCVRCHTGSSPSGGPLPFNDRSQLRRLLNLPNGNAFFDTVMDRVNHSNEYVRMPPVSPLNREEINRLRNTLLSVRNESDTSTR